MMSPRETHPQPPYIRGWISLGLNYYTLTVQTNLFYMEDLTCKQRDNQITFDIYVHGWFMKYN